VTTAQVDWIQSPQVQLLGGFLSGLLLGEVPFGGVGQQLLDAAQVLPHGTPEARLGLALGQMVGGFALATGGLGGGVLGVIASATGLGAVVGAPAVVVSTGVAVGGVANIAAGLRGLSQVMLSSGSGSTGPRGATPAAGEEPAIKAGATGGPTAGKRFSQGTRDEAFAENPTKTCVFCRREGTATQVDHAQARSNGGNATPGNAQLACPHCNASKGSGQFPKTPPIGHEGPWPPSHWGE
jgi:hypothetical protein